jgi:hypothetical protein
LAFAADYRLADGKVDVEKLLLSENMRCAATVGASQAEKA